ncbi:MAG: hypothetical protein JRG91_21245 [Deltaproteobacteria bacterium]|nr:hypothetical protein [Deltaproteobacteria bacterium]
MQRTALALAVIVFTPACYSTSSLLGDTSADSTTDFTDATTDMAVDPGTDEAVDPETDMGPDAGPDVGTEVVPGCHEPNPPPDGPNPFFEIDGESSTGHDNIEMQCIIESVVEGDDNSYIVHLTGVYYGEAHTIYVRSDVPLMLHAIPGEQVDLWAKWNDVWWNPHRWFVLRYTDGPLIMAGGVGRELLPDHDDPPLDPMEIEVFEEECDFEHDECGTFARWAIRVKLHGETRDFLDRTFGSVGSTESAQVLVGESYRYHYDMECDDMPDRRIDWLVFMVPEG